MTPIYTYYDDSVSATQAENQREILDLWQRSWASRGWSPTVLGPEDAKPHPFYSTVTEHVKVEHKGPNPLIYELACFHRWLALARRGGGFSSDYDVMNYGLWPIPPRKRRFEVLAGHRNNGCPCFVYASVAGLAWFINQVITFRHSDCKDRSFSDQSLCVFLSEKSMKDGRGVLLGEEKDLCTVPWDNVASPLIHFPHVCCPQGRLQAISSYTRPLL